MPWPVESFNDEIVVDAWGITGASHQRSRGSFLLHDYSWATLEAAGVGVLHAATAVAAAAKAS